MISYFVKLYMLGLVLWRTKVLIWKAAAFAACQKSILTVRYGHHCPKDAESWQMRAEEMNCNSIRQQCSESLSLDPKKYIFQYHCLINSWMNATIEVCALNQSILGYCAEFDTDGAFIQENYRADCRQFDPPCPKIYDSAEAYKYQSCYYPVYRHYNRSIQPSQEPQIPSNLSLLSRCPLIPFLSFVLIEFYRQFL